MSAEFVDGKDATPLFVLEKDEVAGWLQTRCAEEEAWAKANGFTGALGQICMLPGPGGTPAAALFGFGTAKDRARSRLHYGVLPGKLPKGNYSIEKMAGDPDMAALGWLLGSYSFRRYSHDGAPKSVAGLAAPQGADAPRAEAIAAAAALTCDLINPPANDLGPEDLEKAFGTLADAHSARWSSTVGDALLDGNFPLIHAVGRAAEQAPRLLDMSWGPEDAPKVTLVGKGVCFDTGGLNLKPGRAMGLMKKDMGGAANAMGLAAMIMALNLPVRLRLLVPAVENAVSGNAFRPGDILPSRKGLSVEINNTDAEGRLVLADALALAAEEAPELTISLATLTGAARVALGPDVPPFYTDNDDWAATIATAAAHSEDPLWRMPFWDPYEPDIEPGIAHLDNAPAGGMAGSITAALFLRRFAEGAGDYTHLDIYGWTPSAKPGRAKGGACHGARALLAAIESRFANA